MSEDQPLNRTVPLFDFGGSGQLMHLAVANGFPPETYIPFVRPFLDSYHVVSLPPRALWGNHPPQQMLNWRDLVAVDLLNGIQAHNLRDLIAVGHSFGGVASMVAVLRAPERFRALIMLDPPILPPGKLYWMRFKRMFGAEASDGLESLARRRRTHFESAQAAYEYFRSKRFFAEWPEETIRLYAETMVDDNGDGVTLAWPKEWEAYFFRTWVLYVSIWQDIKKLRGLMPVFLIRGQESDTLLPQAAARMRKLLPQLAYDELAGAGHLLPHTHPQQSARMILDWLQQLEPS